MNSIEGVANERSDDDKKNLNRQKIVCCFLRSVLQESILRQLSALLHINMEL